jgi:hypothetical protein
VSVLEVVEVTPDREFNVAARDDLAAQNRFTAGANTGCMVSRCHAGDVDLESCV